MMKGEKMIARILEITEKLLLIAFAFFLVAIIALRLNIVLGEVRGGLFSSGNFEWLIYVTVFGLMITWLLKKLLVWEIRLTLGKPAKRRRR